MKALTLQLTTLISAITVVLAIILIFNIEMSVIERATVLWFGIATWYAGYGYAALGRKGNKQ